MEEAKIKYIKKRFSFSVTAPDQGYSKKFDLDKNIRSVRGILLSTDQPNLLFYRGSQKIELSGEEIFPEDWESKLIMSGLAVPPDGKFYSLGDGYLAGNGELKVQFKDTNTPLAPFDTYQVNIYLLCEML